MTRQGQVLQEKSRRHMDVLEPIYSRSNKACSDKKQKHLKEFEEAFEL